MFDFVNFDLFAVFAIFIWIMNPDTMNEMSTDLKFLAQGPLDNATRFTAYNINPVKNTSSLKKVEISALLSL